MTLGFIVGKFYPPHRGHKHLIDTARRQVDRLIVMIAHHPSQTIPGEQRRAWLEEIHPDCEICLVPDELENDSRQWAEFTLRYLGRAPDVVFTSEDYGPEYARLMGARHVMVDQARASVPISGTRIRANPLNYLDFLEPCVRAYFVLRVVLIGAESTGKTTLAQQLAERFGTTWVPEYGREHWEKKVAGLSMSDPLPSWSQEEFVHIAAEQQAREDRLAREANRVLFCDTNAFATGTWFQRYYRSRDARVDAIGAAAKADLYLLTAPDVPFVQDGFRDGERIRDWMHEAFRDQLANGPTPWRLIEGPYAARLAAAESAVEALLGGSLVFTSDGKGP
ncbi:Trifunctional NAD biosynthesis/regulator protein NadR [Pirellulimonas nuda]|uniref:Trifunctional NAD biosynthesis/regulator protein NadR n=1 Tax=Pirellulimonas nuda TaxID=2528009 RepID=A0A518D8J5_9BACT|nr:AAA family ATPase [Pirellulimonas nuda]QDU87798.1 Trifunctional NAD biosynthesis/regulator protein NadR [Pirellulimonas nuda]